VTIAEVLPVVEKHLTELLAWAPYVPTPDYEARPEPGRRSTAADLRVPVLNPLA
jgi:lipoyl(octanoyl) transferase